MPLPKPPTEWLRANLHRPWHELTARQQLTLSQAYEYERTQGRPPPAPFPAGSPGERQWEYEGGDPLTVVGSTG